MKNRARGRADALFFIVVSGKPLSVDQKVRANLTEPQRVARTRQIKILPTETKEKKNKSFGLIYTTSDLDHSVVKAMF